MRSGIAPRIGSPWATGEPPVPPLDAGSARQEAVPVADAVEVADEQGDGQRARHDGVLEQAQAHFLRRYAENMRLRPLALGLSRP